MQRGIARHVLYVHVNFSFLKVTPHCLNVSLGYGLEEIRHGEQRPQVPLRNEKGSTCQTTGVAGRFQNEESNLNDGVDCLSSDPSAHKQSAGEGYITLPER
jgi:hypothetical protein